MTRTPIFLHDFQSQRPQHHAEQGAVLEWIAAAHAQAEITLRRPDSREEREEIVRKLRRLVLRFGCSHRPDQPALLGPGRLHPYRLGPDADLPAGPVPGRDALRRAQPVLPGSQPAPPWTGSTRRRPSPPGALIHVTCTGYVAPSAAQRLVAGRDWGRATEVLHAYHMGCYAALPAIRLAAGLAGAGQGAGGHRPHRAVHPAPGPQPAPAGAAGGADPVRRRADPLPRLPPGGGRGRAWSWWTPARSSCRAPRTP